MKTTILSVYYYSLDFFQEIIIFVHHLILFYQYGNLQSNS